MQVYRPILTQHRIRRLGLWGLAMLSWFAAVLFGDRALTFRHLQRFEHATLLSLKQMATGLIIERALNMMRRPPPRRLRYWRHGRDLRRRHWIRSLLGAKLRRALSHRDIARQIAQLIGVLRNLDKFAAQLARRLRRIHRLWRTTPHIAPAELVLGQPAPSPALSDSS